MKLLVTKDKDEVGVGVVQDDTCNNTMVVQGEDTGDEESRTGDNNVFQTL